jgi:hypothetical protein
MSLVFGKLFFAVSPFVYNSMILAGPLSEKSFGGVLSRSGLP